MVKIFHDLNRRSWRTIRRSQEPEPSWYAMKNADNRATERLIGKSYIW